MNNMYLYKLAICLLEEYYGWHMHLELDDDTCKPVVVLDCIDDSTDYIGLILKLPEVFDEVMSHVVAAALYVIGDQYLRNWIDSEEGGEG